VISFATDNSIKNVRFRDLWLISYLKNERNRECTLLKNFTNCTE